MGSATIDLRDQKEHTKIRKIPKFGVIQASFGLQPFKNVKINKEMYGHPDADGSDRFGSRSQSCAAVNLWVTWSGTKSVARSPLPLMCSWCGLDSNPKIETIFLNFYRADIVSYEGIH